MPTPRKIQAWLPQSSLLSHIFYNMYINNSPNTWCLPSPLFRRHVSRKEDSVARKLQRGLSSMETRCERWNIKISEDNTRGVYFSRSRRPPESHLTVNGRNIPFVNSVMYLRVISDKKVTWTLHI
jgi:hypothetical protein